MKIEVQNTDIVIAQLLALPEKVRKAVGRDAAAEANKLLAGVIRQNAPKDSGALQKSIGSVIRKYKSGKIVVGVVGPQSDYAGYTIKKGNKKTFKKAKKGENNKGIRKPSNYAHLVNGGTVNRTNQHGANRGSVTANPFMENSFDAVKNQIQRIFEQKILSEL